MTVWLHSRITAGDLLQSVLGLSQEPSPVVKPAHVYSSLVTQRRPLGSCIADITTLVDGQGNQQLQEI